MKTTLLAAALVVCLSCIAQAETFDIVTYAPPKGWKKETATGIVSYVTQNKKTGTVCRIKENTTRARKHVEQVS